MNESGLVKKIFLFFLFFCLFLLFGLIIAYLAFSYSKYQNRTPILKTIAWYSVPKESRNVQVLNAITNYGRKKAGPDASFTLYEVGKGKMKPFVNSTFYTAYLYNKPQGILIGLFRIIETNKTMRILSNYEPSDKFYDLSEWFPPEGAEVVYGRTIPQLLSYAGYKPSIRFDENDFGEYGQSIDNPIVIHKKKIETLVNDKYQVNPLFTQKNNVLLKKFDSGIELYVKKQENDKMQIKNMEQIYSIKYLDHTYMSYSSYPFRGGYENNVSLESTEWMRGSMFFDYSPYTISFTDNAILPNQECESLISDIVQANSNFDKDKANQQQQEYYTYEYKKNELKYTTLTPSVKIQELKIDMGNMKKITRGNRGDIYIPLDNEELYTQLYTEFQSRLDILLKDKLVYETYKKSFPIIVYKNSLGYYEVFYRDFSDISLHISYPYLKKDASSSIKKGVAEYEKNITTIKRR